MIARIILDFLTLSLYVLLVGFCFCDGFKLHILKKILWFSVFVIITVYVLRIKDEFDLRLILPVPTLLAFLLCFWQKQKTRNKK